MKISALHELPLALVEKSFSYLVNTLTFYSEIKSCQQQPVTALMESVLWENRNLVLPVVTR